MTMASVDVIKCCLDSIRQISDEIKDSIIYLDAGSTESFQFISAFSLFMELGALTVCNLENMSSFDKVGDWSTDSRTVEKIVVITTRFLSDAHRYILRCLTTLQSVQHCTIFTAISEVGHSAYPDSPLGPDAFHEYGSLLTQDYEELVKKQNTLPNLSETNDLKEISASEEEGWSELTSISDEISGFGSNSSPRVTSVGYVEDRGKKLMVSVHHFPLILCPLSPRVFVLPSEGSMAEACLSSEHENSISSGLPASSTGKLADAEDVNPGAALTAQFLYHLASKMDLKLEIFSLGDLSKNVGKLLTDMSSLYDVGRRKRSAGLLLIDRTLDLLTPCCHGDSLVDRFFSSLPRRSRTSSSQMRASQSQLKTGPVKLQRARLDVQIPFDKFLREENSTFRLLESVEAFLHGWKISDSDTQIAELMKFSKKMNNESSFDLLHGSFVATDNFRGAPYLEAMLDRRTKDGTMLIKKWLQESLRKENISLDVKIRPGNPSKSDLQALVKTLGKKQPSFIKYKGIVQLASAAIHALDESNSASWDAFNSAEKILHVNAGDSSQSLAAQITDLVNKSALVGSHSKREKSKGIFTLNDALLLTVVGYILAGDNFPSSGSPFSWQEEHFMKDAIVDAILENPDVSELKFLEGLSLELKDNINKTTSVSKKEDVDFDDDQWGNWGDDDEEEDATKDKEFNNMQLKLELRDRVDNLFKYFHKLASMKRIMPRREGMLNGDPYSSKGLVYKLLRSILDKNDVPGLEYHSSTVGRLFKSGFGRFGLGQAKPSLAEQDVILVFVIGGINGVEVREAHEAVTESSKPDIEMMLGGTTFLTPDNMRELLLGDYGHI